MNFTSNDDMRHCQQKLVRSEEKRVVFKQDSIGGRCCTTLIANVYGDEGQLDETVKCSFSILFFSVLFAS